VCPDPLESKRRRILLVVTCDKQGKRIVARQNAVHDPPGWGLAIAPTTLPKKTLHVKKHEDGC
jgi:hypothetical protein